MNEDEMFDDACDLGQFCMNPCLFSFVKIQKALSRASTKQLQPQQTNDGEPQTSEVNNIQNKQPMKLTLSPRMQQLIYIVGVYGFWTVMFLRLYPLQAKHRDDVSDVHRVIGYVAFTLCFSSWVVASLTKPGDVTQQTMAHYDNYPYDNVMYFDDCVCPTLHIRKLARSKFDRYTRRQVPRFDHFCGWMNQAIGEDNYRHFLAFLTIHTASAVYGSMILGWILWWEASLRSRTGTSEGPEAALTVDYLLHFALAVIAVVAATLVSFFSFHLRNIANGVTTNEFYKLKRMPLDPENTSYSTVSSIFVEHATRNNIYNLGVVGNFYEVMFPRSLDVKSKYA